MGRRRVKTLNDCQRLIAWTINGLISGELKPGTASKIGYLTNIQRGIIVDGDIETS